MRTSQEWVSYFKENLEIKRIDWQQPPGLTEKELKSILKSMQAWQLGETSDGKNLLKACSNYAEKIGDPYYIKAMQLFIKEEQKHGNNLGKYLDLIGQPRIKKNWGDTLFRIVRHLNNSMEWWTITVIIIESAAQIFYQSLKDATGCNLLRQICTDILIDEATHIQFQQERLAIIFRSKSITGRRLSYYWYKYFFLIVSLVVWAAHKKLFKAGGNPFRSYYHKMKFKLMKTIGKLKYEIEEDYTLQPS
jgi:hypothetical protein